MYKNKGKSTYISQHALGGLRHPLHQIRNLIHSLSVSRTTTHYLPLYLPV